MILAPLRGVTIRCFRETFAEQIAEAGFSEAVTPFITANAGVDPLRDRELRQSPQTSQTSRTSQTSQTSQTSPTFLLTPQFIGKDPAALTACLARTKAAGFETADLNAGCPFPMVRNKGRGSGLLMTPEVFERMLAAGCAALGPGRFSVKARLGVDRPDELLRLMPIVNRYPLRFLTVHARTARQMYAGECDRAAFGEIVAASRVPVVYNGDAAIGEPAPAGAADVMVGRAFVRGLGGREDIAELLERYIAASQAELHGDRPVLGRLKELLAYWQDLPGWRRRWSVAKLCRTVDELRSVTGDI